MRLKEKRVLVTGACGFIGSHLVERLVREGADVCAYVYYNSFSSWGWLDTISRDVIDHIDVVQGDVRDAVSVRKAVEGVDVVFHLAALIGIPYSYYAPTSYVDTNISGTLNILQACREFGVDKLLTTSTSEVYGSALYTPIDESHPRQGQSPYSATKIAADALAESYYRSFNVPVVIVRPFNTFGPRQSARAIIPTIITQMLSEKTEIMLGSTETTRDFVYVEDTVDAFISIAKANNVCGKELNIATQREWSIEVTAKKIAEIIGRDVHIVKDEQRVRPERSEVDRLLGSNERIGELVGWKPQYSFEDGLARTVKWFRVIENSQSYKSHIYNV